MLVGVLGSKGRLGSELLKNNYLPLDCDITDEMDLLETIKKVNPDIIINCASYTDVDKAEDNLLRCYAVNAYAPDLLTSIFSKKIIHISTDYIFDGTRGLYRENDIPNPINNYGFSKFWGEIPIRRNPNNLIIRTTVLYDCGDKPNFVKSVYNSLLENKTIHVPEIYGNPTWIPHLVKGIIKCVDDGVSGLLNIVGRDWVSRVELARKIANKFGFDKSLVQVGLNNGLAKRGNFYGLNVEKADYLKIPIYSLDEGLEEFANCLKSR